MRHGSAKQTQKNKKRSRLIRVNVPTPQQKLPSFYEEKSFANLTMEDFLKESKDGSIWNDLSKTSSKFADKYFGKGFMAKLKIKNIEGYRYIRNLITNLRNQYSNNEQIMKDSKSLECREFVLKVMQVGKKNTFGFTDKLVCFLIDTIKPQPGISKINDKLIPFNVYMQIHNFLPTVWFEMRSKFFSSDEHVHFYDTLINRLLTITIHFIIDTLRLVSNYCVDEHHILTSSQIARTEKSILESFIQQNGLLKKYIFCRRGTSLIKIMLKKEKFSFQRMFGYFESDLPPSLRSFLKKYIGTISTRMENFVQSGEFKYNFEQMVNFRNIKLVLKMTPGNRNHEIFGDFMNLVADRILNTNEFPLFGKKWKPIIRNLTKNPSPDVFNSADFVKMFKSFNMNCRQKLLKLSKNHQNAESIEYYCRAGLTRFVFLFCASVIRFSSNVHLSADQSISNIRYDGRFELSVSNEGKWQPKENVESDNRKKLMKPIEVTDLEPEVVVQQCPKPSTSSGYKLENINPEFSQFYERIENDPTLSEKTKEMVRTTLFTNDQLLKELRRAEKRYDHLCNH